MPYSSKNAFSLGVIASISVFTVVRLVGLSNEIVIPRTTPEAASMAMVTHGRASVPSSSTITKMSANVLSTSTRSSGCWMDWNRPACRSFLRASSEPRRIFTTSECGKESTIVSTTLRPWSRGSIPFPRHTSR